MKNRVDNQSDLKNRINIPSKKEPKKQNKIQNIELNELSSIGHSSSPGAWTQSWGQSGDSSLKISVYMSMANLSLSIKIKCKTNNSKESGPLSLSDPGLPNEK